jgi:hypothetical protein
VLCLVIRPKVRACLSIVLVDISGQGVKRQSDSWKGLPWANISNEQQSRRLTSLPGRLDAVAERVPIRAVRNGQGK